VKVVEDGAAGPSIVELDGESVRASVEELEAEKSTLEEPTAAELAAVGSTVDELTNDELATAGSAVDAADRLATEDIMLEDPAASDGVLEGSVGEDAVSERCTEELVADELVKIEDAEESGGENDMTVEGRTSVDEYV